jgi:endo-alpha-1,4-polygalactosaminidase (GH114 family)
VKRGKSAMFTVQPLPDAASTRSEPAAPVINDKVRADTAKAIAENNVTGYLEWLAGQGAPEYVIDYVNTQAKEPTE